MLRMEAVPASLMRVLDAFRPCFTTAPTPAPRRGTCRSGPSSPRRCRGTPACGTCTNMSTPRPGCGDPAGPGSPAPASVLRRSWPPKRPAWPCPPPGTATRPPSPCTSGGACGAACSAPDRSAPAWVRGITHRWSRPPRPRPLVPHEDPTVLSGHDRQASPGPHRRRMSAGGDGKADLGNSGRGNAPRISKIGDLVCRRAERIPGPQLTGPWGSRCASP